MANEFLAVTDGTFTLSETENKKQFYFYRNDKKVLTNIDWEPMNLYQAYIMQKMMNGDITDIVMNDIYSAMSDDKKCLRLTIYDVGENPSENDNSITSKKQPNFFKKLFTKLFG